MRCPASLRLEADLPDTTSRYAAEGTLAHTLASDYLQHQRHPSEVLGHTIQVDGFDFVVDDSMVAYVLDYCKLVMEYAAKGTLAVEREVSFSDAVRVPGSFGTADALVFSDDTLYVIDLKYGMGVRVMAQDNEQLMLYALGALETYGFLGDFKEVSMIIHQPRLNHVAEFVVPVGYIHDFAERAELAAQRALFANDPEYVPGEKQCKFCKAKAICPALKGEVEASTADLATPEDFADLAQTDATKLAADMERVAIIEQWCAAIREEVERRLLAGETIPGFGLEMGRKGNRKWIDEAEVAEVLKKHKVDEKLIYDRKLHTPTKIEKLLKSHPDALAEVLGLTSRSDGKPSVVRSTGKGQVTALSSVADSLRDLIAK